MVRLEKVPKVDGVREFVFFSTHVRYREILRTFIAMDEATRRVSHFFFMERADYRECEGRSLLTA